MEFPLSRSGPNFAWLSTAHLFVVRSIRVPPLGCSWLLQMLATWTRLENTAVAMFPVVLFFLVAFAGFIVRLPTLPTYLKGWASDLSFARWAMQASM